MDQSATVLDFEFGMSQLSGNKTLLLTLLNKFSDEYRTANDDLQRLVKEGNFVDAYSLIHTLKGVAGNLGLFALHHASKPVEASVRNDKCLPDDYPSFSALIDETIAAVEALSAAPEPTAAPIANSAVATQAREQFIAALKASEFISQSTLDEWLSVMSLPAETKQSIEDAVDELDYDEAIELLEKA
ncbi:Hpt domain-containing protein [Alteromonas sp. 1_MG-2023]|uniref:Hpt domain-containing protein n=1 Tax=Alteromonas sp. 1_MG-2023 TaxID=3062669 RepID=UPI0026E2ACED|nr:Hpt domain-containing protein [Alteromonas sp. 1_MG-2023]MDO6567155.1 Hpt domain-containing protein [Alteromonas sp. 1_MG-2023]